MKKLMTIAGIFIAGLALLMICKNGIAKGAIESVTQAMTGCRLSIGKLDIGLLNTKIAANNLKLYNPSGFVDRTMMDLPELYVDCDSSTIFSGKPHINELRVHLRELLVVKNAKGELNLMALKPKQGSTGEKKTGGAPPITIGLLRLKVEKVVYKDYSRGASHPFVQEFNVNLDESYQNVSNINAIVPLIVSKALVNTTIASLANFRVDDLMSNFSAVGLDAGKLGLNQIRKAQVLLGSTAAGAFGDLEKATGHIDTDKAVSMVGGAAKSAGKTAEKAADEITSAL